MVRSTRALGLTIPLFSIRTETDSGIGEIPALPTCARWAKHAGCRVIQVLPPHQLSKGETSPYGALTAFGLDPIYIGLSDLPGLGEHGLAEILGKDGTAERNALREASAVDYARVRAFKEGVFERAFERFYESEWRSNGAQAKLLAGFIEREREWLDDLALYLTLRELHNQYGWRSWPEGERDRDFKTLDELRKQHSKKILRAAYLQWVAFAQWEKARAGLFAEGVELMGDLPFVVCDESADRWSHPTEFQRDITLGAPPDAFAPEGQDWGLPAYAWDVMDANNLRWLRARTRHAVRLYDRFRLDHVVGFFRQWLKRRGNEAKGYFEPAEEPAQADRGRRVLRAMLEEAGQGRIIAEDLGVIPPFVRQTLTAMNIPGYRVIPWERDNGVYRDAAHFPALSVATWSTHDTSPITSWWDEFEDWERSALSAKTGVAPHLNETQRTPELLRYLLASGSSLVLVLPQELTGERTRINTPATVTSSNWTYRLPRPFEEMERDAVLHERLRQIGAYARAAGR